MSAQSMVLVEMGFQIKCDHASALAWQEIDQEIQQLDMMLSDVT